MYKKNFVKKNSEWVSSNSYIFLHRHRDYIYTRTGFWRAFKGCL